MSIKVYKNNEWHDLLGQKLYHNGSWHELNESAKLYHNGRWHYIDKSKIPLTLTNVGRTNSTISVDNYNCRIIFWKKSMNEEWQRRSSSFTLTLLPGEKVFFMGTLIYGNDQNYTHFSFDGTIAASGNIQSMNDWQEECAPYCYQHMFEDCTGLVSAPDLPATTLAERCYLYMFKGCKSLTSAPKLPATTLAPSCYYSMFSDCEGLVSAPDLPATTLAERCYCGMFGQCKRLVSAPDLPATTLVAHCYHSMFSECEGLVSAPDLPVTTLAEYCYAGMFADCSRLASAIDLPATTLVEGCYDGMFIRCASLKEIKVAFEDWQSQNSTLNWFAGVGGGGTFYKPSALPEVHGDSLIPPYWNVVNID